MKSREGKGEFHKNEADLRPLADAILDDNASPPQLVLAAWHYLYGWKTHRLPELVAEAFR